MRLDTRGFETHADNELPNAGTAQNSDVPLEQGFAAELEQTLGPVAHLCEAPTHACRKHHRLHRSVAYQKLHAGRSPRCERHTCGSSSHAHAKAMSRTLLVMHIVSFALFVCGVSTVAVLVAYYGLSDIAMAL